MKASLKLRDDDSPVLRAKLPLTLAGLPLSSGVALRSPHDITLHLGTLFKAGPSCKLAYKPKHPHGHFFLVLKTGFGLWGSPINAPFAIAAHFNLSAAAGDPFFAVHVKPKFGDFSLRKQASSVIDAGDKRAGKSFPLHKVGPFPNGDMDMPPSPEKLKASASDSDLLVGPNFFFKSEGLEMENRRSSVDGFVDRNGDGRPNLGENRRPIVEGFVDRNGDGRPNLGIGRIAGNADNGACGQDSKNQQNLLGFSEDHSPSVRLPFGFNKIFKGWAAVAHSSLPLGKHARLSIRWGMELPADDWGNRLKSFSVHRLPILLFDKISVEAVDSPPNKGSEGGLLLHDLAHPLDYSLPRSEDGQELARIAAAFYSTKRQLHVLAAENKLLQRAVEEIRAELEHREHEDRVPRPRPSDDSQNKVEKNVTSQTNSERKRDCQDVPNKPSVFESYISENSPAPGNPHSEVSEELKKAIFNASNRSSGERIEF